MNAKFKSIKNKKCKITITSQLVDAGSAMASLPNAANIKKASIAFTTSIWPATCKNIVKTFSLTNFLHLRRKTFRLLTFLLSVQDWSPGWTEYNLTV